MPKASRRATRPSAPAGARPTSSCRTEASMDLSTPVRYFDRDFQVDAVKILPGQYYASKGEGSIATVLGSCVSTCLWDSAARIGGMNHFMLPGDALSSTSPWAVSARSGVY